ncbi:UNVERIFIED_CONTAM: hypothetical protein Sradi_5743900 [Sesamum radiatum]|uniref:Reverse transcriptase domain-containing protein n=1 Tax=Sesamum radiatum TaxID=300843 RepID=A0AAW2L5Q6_SESRA
MTPLTEYVQKDLGSPNHASKDDKNKSHPSSPRSVSSYSFTTNVALVMIMLMQVISWGSKSRLMMKQRYPKMQRYTENNKSTKHLQVSYDGLIPVDQRKNSLREPSEATLREAKVILTYLKPYTPRIHSLKMPMGYQLPKFQQFDGKGNPKQHVAHFVETCNNAGTYGDHLVNSAEEDIAQTYHVTLIEDGEIEEEDAEDAPIELEEGVEATIDELKEANLGNTEDPQPIYTSVSLTQEEEEAYITLLHEFKDMFVWSYKEMSGLDPKVKYPMWISSIVPVRNKNGQIQVCVDFRDLNNACPKDDFPLLIAELTIDATTSHEALSFMDGSSGYNQVCMAQVDEELTVFCTPKGIYCYKVMPFGLKNVGATYQSAMQRIVDDMLHKNVECYVDDLVVKSKKREDRLYDLRKVFERLSRYQLKMKPFKYAFGITFGKFLGFIVRQRGIVIQQAKIDAILRMPEP